jgi:hypothetical protein
MRFTFDEPGWDLNSNADPSDATIGPVPGDSAALILKTLGTYGGTAQIYGALAIPPVVIGQSYEVRAKVNADGAHESTPLQILINGSDVEFARPIYKSELGTGMQPIELGSFVPTEANLILFAALYNSRIQDPPNATVGRWEVGEILIGEPFAQGFEMSKRREIRERIVARCGTVLVGNGYALSIGEAVTGPLLVPGSVNAWPHVQVRHGEEIKVVDAFTTKNVGAQFRVGMFCRKSETTNPDDQCEDGCAEIEKALELFENGQWLGLPYIENVFVSGIDPEELPPEVGNDVRLWVMTVDVTYNHDRRDP